MVLHMILTTEALKNQSSSWTRVAFIVSRKIKILTRPKPSDFSGRKNPQHAFLGRGSKAVGPMSQICGT
jgi:hypothetical protein